MSSLEFGRFPGSERFPGLFVTLTSGPGTFYDTTSSAMGGRSVRGSFSLSFSPGFLFMGALASKFTDYYFAVSLFTTYSTAYFIGSIKCTVPKLERRTFTSSTNFAVPAAMESSPFTADSFVWSSLSILSFRA